MKTREEARDLAVKMVRKAFNLAWLAGEINAPWIDKWTDAMNASQFEAAADIARAANSYPMIAKAAIASAVGCIALPSGQSNEVVMPVIVEQLKR